MQPASEVRTGNRLEGFDALRGIAALMVALLHMQHATGAPGIFASSYLAVDLFFALSGYVLARTYEPKFAQGLAVIDFAVIRLRRLWPTMACGALLGMLAFWSDNSAASSITVFFMAISFVPMLEAGSPTYPTNPPAWSIVLEIIANAFHALLLRHLSLPWLLAVAATSGAILVTQAENMNVGGAMENLHLGVPRILFSYTIGIVMWRVLRDRAVLPGWLGIVAVPLVLLTIGALPVTAGRAEFLIVLVLCPLAVASGLGPVPVARRLFAFLGAISFPLYAVHFPVSIALARAGYGLEAMIPASIAAAWVVSVLTDERRVRAAIGWLRRGAFGARSDRAGITP